MENKTLKTLIKQAGLLNATIHGALDGLQFDNTDDVIEKSVVIAQLKEELLLIQSIEKILKENVAP